jgi:predicted RNA-binding protein
MCLAKVTVRKNDEDTVYAKNISNIRIDGGLIVLTDILGKDYELEGSLLKADLVNGEVLIKAS